MGLDLPQFVVVGGQSSGKSSVLENLVGREFLPRGSGIVTRRPLILQLIQTNEDKDYAIFTHDPKKKHFDFNEVREEIKHETDRLTGTNKGISSEPIILRIFSPNVIPLTLVDTPGITRVPVGDQPPDIEVQIREMVKSYVTPKNALILAVHPANQDLATSDAINLALATDPQGDRTLGVITKLDLMDHGTNAVELLSGKTFKLKHGFIGVINRSQRDLTNNKTVHQAIEDEKEFFNNRMVYSPVKHRCGRQKLAVKCNQILTQHVKQVLPGLKRESIQKLRAAEAELEELGEPLEGNVKDKKWALMQVLNNFTSIYSRAIDGSRSDVVVQELHGGARIRYIFEDGFKKQLNDFSGIEGFSTKDFRTVIRNAAGPRPALFIPDGAFEVLIKQQITRLKGPSMRAAELVKKELLRIVSSVNVPEFERFPLLRERVIEVAETVLDECAEPAYNMISNLIECELAYINTSHPDFIGSMHGTLLKDEVVVDPQKKNPPPPPKKSTDSGFFSSIFGGKKKVEKKVKVDSSGDAVFDAESIDQYIAAYESTDLSERENIQIALLKKLLNSYYDIAKKNIQDNVTKAIWHFLVTQSRESISRAVITEVYSSADTKKLLQESEHVVERRKVLRAEIEMLRKTNEILQKSYF
eukprot:CAMPEP_0117017720 /NCGR_PEP_ID=MMETSP0472-20121206/13802_1 /TAXON_ID=693140 ORGANISM="Tiarina fusus, Strain LIS" /NCGR_SAMPLE_ID=MMETSP0472 /ASSEMBLY_ACC=CAM_ASM_000603 /LENGTH=642 /DNA_ID=CAMNT_0004722175 /DNA_START=261 /DNA_END=2189 /DNA_ORIENTATION=-